VSTEKEIEAEARKQCLRAFEPYTYGPYFDALRDEFRRKAREILEMRERRSHVLLMADDPARAEMYAANWERRATAAQPYRDFRAQ
jgi:hypothetical protein